MNKYQQTKCAGDGCFVDKGWAAGQQPPSVRIIVLTKTTSLPGEETVPIHSSFIHLWIHSIHSTQFHPVPFHFHPIQFNSIQRKIPLITFWNLTVHFPKKPALLLSCIRIGQLPGFGAAHHRRQAEQSECSSWLTLMHFLHILSLFSFYISSFDAFSKIGCMFLCIFGYNWDIIPLGCLAPWLSKNRPPALTERTFELLDPSWRPETVDFWWVSWTLKRGGVSISYCYCWWLKSGELTSWGW